MVLCTALKIQRGNIFFLTDKLIFVYVLSGEAGLVQSTSWFNFFRLSALITMVNSRIVCNTCNVGDASPVIHCSTCCNAFHYKCVFPEVPTKFFEYLVAMPGIQWYCSDDRNFCVSKLLDRISLMEQKLMEKPSEFDIGLSNEVSSIEVQTSPSLCQCRPSTRRTLRSKRTADKATENLAPAIPQKKSRVNTPIKLIAVPDEANADTKHTENVPPVHVYSSVPGIIVSNQPNEQQQNIEHQCLKENQNEEMLVVVPPNRSIFLSRLSLDTTENVLKKYIADKFSITSGFGLRKFAVKESAQFSSFLLRCDDNLYDTFMNHEMWPRHMKVHQFFQKRSYPNRHK